MTVPPAISTGEFETVASTSVGVIVFAGVLGVMLAMVFRRMGMPAMVGLLVGGGLSGPMLGVDLSQDLLVHELLYFAALGSLVLLIARWREAWPTGRCGRFPSSARAFAGASVGTVGVIGLLGLLAGWYAGAAGTGLQAGLLATAFVLPGAIWFDWVGRPPGRDGASAGRLCSLAGAGVILLGLPWVGAGREGATELVRVYAMGLYMGTVAFLLGTAWVPGLYTRARRTSGGLGKIGVVVALLSLPVMLAAWMRMPMAFGAVWAGLLVSGCFAVTGDQNRLSERILAGGLLLLLGMSIDVRTLVSAGLVAPVVAAALAILVVRNIAGVVLESVAQWVDGPPGSMGSRRRVAAAPLAGLPLLVLYEGAPAIFAPIGGTHVVLQVTLGVFGCVLVMLAAISTWRSAKNRENGPARSQSRERLDSGSGSLQSGNRSFGTTVAYGGVVVAGAGAGSRTVRLVPVAEQSAAAGRAVGELDLPRRFGVVPLGVWRGDAYLPIAGPDTQILERGDLLVLAGPAGRLEAAAGYLAGTDSASRTSHYTLI